MCTSVASLIFVRKMFSGLRGVAMRALNAQLHIVDLVDLVGGYWLIWWIWWIWWTLVDLVDFI